MKVKLDECNSEINKLKWAKDGINKDLAKKSKTIELLQQNIDTVDQKQRETRVRISGIPEEQGEDLSKTIVKMAKNKMGLKKIKDTDLVQIYRSGKKKTSRNRDVIVQFNCKTTRDTFHAARKKLQTTNHQESIYVNDDLTDYRQKLLFDTRRLVKKKKMKAAWSQHGNVMILPEHGGPKCIHNYIDLRNISGTDIYGDSYSVHVEEDELETCSDSSY